MATLPCWQSTQGWSWDWWVTYLRLPHGSPRLSAELGLAMGLASRPHAHHGGQGGRRDKDLLGQCMHGHSLGSRGVARQGHMR